MDKSYYNWRDFMGWQLDFYDRSSNKRRVDGEYDWAWNDSQKKWHEKLIEKIKEPIRPWYVSIFNPPVVPFTKRWFNERFEQLWNSRQILNDELSKLLFDNHLVLSMVGHRKYYFPRVYFGNLIEIKNEEEFISDLPNNYMGLPLKIFNIKFNNINTEDELKIISTKLQIELTNKYQQYFFKRGGIDFAPTPGEVIFDCGACIGDLSTVFASLVGNTGEVHLFDPVPLHSRYCRLQIDLNKSLGHIFNINTVAVGNVSKSATGTIKDSAIISPGGCVVDNFETVSLDDYAAKMGIKKVDYIKMDIEGSEVVALQGAARIIHDFKPRLAISTYHKADDLWEIPALIMKLNPNYKLYFEHHAPKIGESVYYAI